MTYQRAALFSESFPEIKLSEGVVLQDKGGSCTDVLEDEDCLEPKEASDIETDDEKDMYEIVHDLGFLGNVEQDKKKIDVKKKKEKMKGRNFEIWKKLWIRSRWLLSKQHCRK